MNALSRIAFAIATLVVVASCGSGSVGPPPVNDPAKITILPDTATLYSGYPTTFSVTGGTGAYIVTSSNQAIVPQVGNVLGSSFTVVPNLVTADTTVILTARDTGTAAPVSATLTVRPSTVNNLITVTPGNTDCSPAVCSGGDAVVSATISQGGIPIPARGVRFDVISGDFLFITSPATAPETLATSVTTITDEAGVARARLRANANAANQVGILQVTDLGTGAFQRTTFFIARTSTTQSGFFTIPTSITYTGPNNQACASSGAVASEIFVFGGTPPYTISNSAPGAFFTNTNVVSASGGSVRVTPSGACVDNASIAFTDAAGRTISVSVSNKLGTATVPAPPAFAISPTSVTLTSCTSTASVTAVGGQSNGSYVATSNYSVVLATVNSGLISIRRAPGTDATGVTGVQVAVTDGATIKTVDVALSGAAAGICP